MINFRKFIILLVTFNQVLCECEYNDTIINSEEIKNCQTLILNNVHVNCESNFMELQQLEEFTLNAVKLFNCPDVRFVAYQGYIEDTEFLFKDAVIKSYEIGRTWTGYFQADQLSIKGYVRSYLNTQVGIFVSNITKFDSKKRTTIEFGSVVFHQGKSLNLINVDIIANTSLQCQDSVKYQRPISFMNINGNINQNEFIFEPFIDLDGVMQQLNSNSLIEMYYKLTSPELQYQNYSMIMVVYGSILLNESTKLSGNMIGLFAENLLISNNSVIDASVGCQQNEGPGRGVSFIYTVDECAGSGGSSAGKGGVGIRPDEFSRDYFDYECKVLMEALYYFRKINPYNGVGGIYMGSGGGNSGQETLLIPYNRTIGSGGGGVYLGLTDTLDINGSIHADGQSGYQENFVQDKILQSFGGGGAGGYIILSIKQLIGTGNITAIGGPSDQQSYSGEGGGGFINLENHGNNNKIFTGKLNVSKGYRNALTEFLGSDGSIIATGCKPGYEFDIETLRCKMCLPGYYQFLTIGVCTPCPGYTQKEISLLTSYTSTQQCQLEICEEFHCDPLQFLTNFVSSLWGILSYVSLFTLIVSGYIIRRLYRLKEQVDMNEDLPFDFESATKHMAVNQMITEKLRETQQFKLVDLLYHVHRVAIHGDNTWQNPWQFPYLPNEEIQYLIDQVVWTKFASRFNKLAEWKKYEKFLLAFTCIAYYPLYWVLIRQIKKKKWRLITQFVSQTDLQFLRCFQSQDDQSFVRFKINKSSDYTLLFLDIFNYKNTHMKYFFLQFPYMLLLSGQGDYIRPFYLCESDPFVSLLYFVINRQKHKNSHNPHEDERFKILEQLASHKKRMDNSQKLNRFLAKFNLFARTIDYGGGSEFFAHRIRELLKLTKQWNLKFFIEFNVIFELIIMQSSGDASGVQQITVLENEESPLLLQFLIEVHQKHMNQNSDTKIGIFVYDSGLDADSVTDMIQRQRITVSDVQKFSVLKDDEEEINIDDLKEIYLQRTNQYQTNLISSLNSGDLRMRHKNQKQEKFQWLRNLFIIIVNILIKIRYLFFAHRVAMKNKYTVILFQLILSFLDGIFLPIYLISFIQDQGGEAFLDLQLLFWPFPFVIILAPVTGCLWMSTQSYGIAKLYLIFTGLSFINLFLNIILTIDTSSASTAAKTAIFIQIADLLIKLGLIFIGKRILSVNIKLNKLNQAKQFIN